MSQPNDLGSPDQPEPTATSGTRPRGLGQRISLIGAFLFYGGALACLGALGYWLGDLGGDHPVIASLGASVVFFVGAGVVLHVMGLANLPSLRFDREDGPPPGA